MKSTNYPILFVCYASLFIFGLVELCRGTLYPQILSSFAIGAGIGSLFFTTSSFVGLITNFFAPKWLARFGKLRSLHYALIFYVAGGVLFGLSSYAGMWLHFLGAFFVGVGSTGVGITINVLTAEATGPEVRGKALSGLHAMYALAALLAPLLVSLGSKFGMIWNQYFFITSLMTVLLIVKTGALVKKEKSEEQVALPPMPYDWKPYLPYAILFGFYVAGEILASTRLSLFLQQGMNLSPEDARTILFQYFLLFFLGRLAFMFINIKPQTYNLLKMCLIISITCSIAGIFISPWYFPLAGLGMSAFFPMAMDFVSDRFPLEKQSVISVIFLCVGIMISGFHFGFGQMVESAGLSASMLLIPGLHFCCYLILLTLKPKPSAPLI
jgi:MFS family permease